MANLEIVPIFFHVFLSQSVFIKTSSLQLFKRKWQAINNFVKLFYKIYEFNKIIHNLIFTPFSL